MINHYKDPYSTTRISWKVRVFFCGAFRAFGLMRSYEILSAPSLECILPGWSWREAVGIQEPSPVESNATALLVVKCVDMSMFGFCCFSTWPW